MTKALKGAGVKIGAPVKKAILSALSERDEAAAICLDSDGKPEPDPELRDHELVPLKEDWKDYVAREVTPFVPDAWVDETYRDDTDKGVGRVGYEINFNRYFYRYVAAAPAGRDRRRAEDAGERTSPASCRRWRDDDFHTDPLANEDPASIGDDQVQQRR